MATIYCDREQPCGAMSLDITDDGKAEVLLQRGIWLEAWTPDATGWRKLGDLGVPCPVDSKPFLAGDVRVAPPRDKVQDVMVGGVRLRLDPELAACPPGGAGG